MKKLFCILAYICALLSLTAFAEETVIYENDFSDPETISDFKQYRMAWEIKNGSLYLTGRIDSDITTTVDTCFSHLIYQMEEELSDYIVEVDYMNAQTNGGVIFRADQDMVDNQQNSFYGLKWYNDGRH